MSVDKLETGTVGTGSGGVVTIRLRCGESIRQKPRSGGEGGEREAGDGMMDSMMGYDR